MILPLQKILLKKSESTQDLLSWIRLSRSENVGPISFFQLLSRYESIDAALDALPQ